MAAANEYYTKIFSLSSPNRGGIYLSEDESELLFENGSFRESYLRGIKDRYIQDNLRLKRKGTALIFSVDIKDIIDKYSKLADKSEIENINIFTTDWCSDGNIYRSASRVAYNDDKYLNQVYIINYNTNTHVLTMSVYNLYSESGLSCG